MFRLRSVAYALRESFWFVPSLFALGALALHFLAGAVDDRLSDDLDVYGGDAPGAREIFSAVAASIITVAGVVFSVTMVTLSIASSQFGPRLIRNFMRDTGTQVVLGVLITTFAFSLLSLRRVEPDTPVPQVSLSLTFILVAVSVAALIYFIHHVAASVQAETVVARLGDSLRQAVERRLAGEDFMRRFQPVQEEEARALADRTRREGAPLAGDSAGFVKVIDYRRLIDLAVSNRCDMALVVRPGDFVSPGSALAMVYPRERLNQEMQSRVRSAFLFGAHRTLEQDVSFGFEELVDVAVRALSPGVNVPFLAALCVQHMGATLARFGEATTPVAAYLDPDGRGRLYLIEPDFPALLATVYSEMRRHGGGSMPVLEACYKTLGDLAERVSSEAGRKAIVDQAALLNTSAQVRLQDEKDRLIVTAYHYAVREKLKAQQTARAK